MAWSQHNEPISRAFPGTPPLTNGGWRGPNREGGTRGWLPSWLLDAVCVATPASTFLSQAGCKTAKPAGPHWGDTILFFLRFFLSWFYRQLRISRFPQNCKLSRPLPVRVTQMGSLLYFSGTSYILKGKSLEMVCMFLIQDLPSTSRSNCL